MYTSRQFRTLQGWPTSLSLPVKFISMTSSHYSSFGNLWIIFRELWSLSKYRLAASKVVLISTFNQLNTMQCINRSSSLPSLCKSKRLMKNLWRSIKILNQNKIPTTASLSEKIQSTEWRALNQSKRLRIHKLTFKSKTERSLRIRTKTFNQAGLLESYQSTKQISRRDPRLAKLSINNRKIQVPRKSFNLQIKNFKNFMCLARVVARGTRNLLEDDHLRLCWSGRVCKFQEILMMHSSVASSEKS